MKLILNSLENSPDKCISHEDQVCDDEDAEAKIVKPKTENDKKDQSLKSSSWTKCLYRAKNELPQYLYKRKTFKNVFTYDSYLHFGRFPDSWTFHWFHPFCLIHFDSTEPPEDKWGQIKMEEKIKRILVFIFPFPPCFTWPHMSPVGLRRLQFEAFRMITFLQSQFLRWNLWMNKSSFKDEVSIQLFVHALPPSAFFERHANFLRNILPENTQRVQRMKCTHAHVSKSLNKINVLFKNIQSRRSFGHGGRSRSEAEPSLWLQRGPWNSQHQRQIHPLFHVFTAKNIPESF